MSRLGRPPKYRNPEEIQHEANKYFNRRLDADGNPKLNESGQVKSPITYTGLCLALDLSRECFDRYMEKEEFHDTMKALKMRVESYYENRLSYANATGSIFALKSMAGWKDASEVNHNHNHNLMTVVNELSRQRAGNIIEASPEVAQIAP